MSGRIKITSHPFTDGSKVEQFNQMFFLDQLQVIIHYADFEINSTHCTVSSGWSLKWLNITKGCKHIWIKKIKRSKRVVSNNRTTPLQNIWHFHCIWTLKLMKITWYINTEWILTLSTSKFNYNKNIFLIYVFMEIYLKNYFGKDAQLIICFWKYLHLLSCLSFQCI